MRWHTGAVTKGRPHGADLGTNKPRTGSASYNAFAVYADMFLTNPQIDTVAVVNQEHSYKQNISVNVQSIGGAKLFVLNCIIFLTRSSERQTNSRPVHLCIYTVSQKMSPCYILNNSANNKPIL